MEREEQEGALELAERRFEENDFAGAVQAYREAALSGEPPPDALANMVIAHAEEGLSFLRELRARYPRSFSVALAELQLAARLHPGIVARARCAELSKKFAGEAGAERSIRKVRLEAGVDGRVYDSLVEDFTFLWDASASQPSPRPHRAHLLRTLARITDVNAGKVLGALADTLPEGSPARRFVLSKQQELLALALSEKGD